MAYQVKLLILVVSTSYAKVLTEIWLNFQLL